MSVILQTADKQLLDLEIVLGSAHGDTVVPLRRLQAKSEIAGVPERTTEVFSATERAEFFEIIEPTMRIADRESFFHWTQTKLQRIFPHGKLICGYGLLEKEGVNIHTVMGCNFPTEYLQALQLPGGLTHTPIIRKWLSQQQPVLFEPDPEKPVSPEHAEWFNNFQRFDLRNIAAHGLCDNIKQTASYFSFSAIPGRLTARHANLLKLLVPHLHVTLMRILSNAQPESFMQQQSSVVLSKRELEILSWISSGKTNWEIAQVLGLSESTVKNHIHRMLVRLNVGTRAQALAKAINLKLIHTSKANSQ